MLIKDDNNFNSRILLVLVGFFILIALSLNNISAANRCWVETNAATCNSNGGQVLMHLSGSTNAHGELVSQLNYPSVLCCNFGAGSTTCLSNKSNELLALYSATNSHAEIPDLLTPNYNVNVCYDSFGYCRSTTFNCNTNPPNNETTIVYLSNTTNAHLESPGLVTQIYGTKICCSVVTQPFPINSTPSCTINSASWSATEKVAGQNVSLNVVTSNCSGQQISFEVRESSNFGVSWSVTTNPQNVSIGSNGNIVGTWVAEFHNNHGFLLGEKNPPEYYFIARVVGNTSIQKQNSIPDLKVNQILPIQCQGVVTCANYLNNQTCGNDLCGVASKSVPPNINCNAPGINCFCNWNSTINQCGSGWSGNGTGKTSCGDSSVNQPNSAGTNEQCDPNSGPPVFLSGQDTCVNLKNNLGYDSFTGGTLGCTGGCTFDTTQCVSPNPPVCGDNVINQLNETCDSTAPGLGDFGGNTCQTLGFSGGTLGCFSSTSTNPCQFDKSKCTLPLLLPTVTLSANPSTVGSGGSSTLTWTSTQSTSCSAAWTSSSATSGSQSVSPSATQDYSITCTGAGGSTTQKTTITLSGVGKLCGDGNIDIPNSANRTEDCDPGGINGALPNLKITSCSVLAPNLYQSGNVNCYSDCTYNISNCMLRTGVTPSCGDGVIDMLSKECDPNSNAGIGVPIFRHGYTCQSLGYTSGTLKCTSSCKIDKSGCVAPVVSTTTSGSGIGTCYYQEQSTGDTCSTTGYLTINLTASWVWSPQNPNQNDPQNLAGKCQSTVQTFQCPAQIPLPFFGFYNFLVALVLIAFIYLIIGFRKRR